MLALVRVGVQVEVVAQAQLAAELAAEPELQELVLVVEPGLQAQVAVLVVVQLEQVEVQAAELLGLPAVERVVEQEQLVVVQVVVLVLV